MSMSQRLAEDAVLTSYTPSKIALEALQRGDVGALIASHRDRFAGWSMKVDDDGDDDSDDDDDNDDDDSDGDDDDDDEDSDDDDDEDGPEGKKSKKRHAKDDPAGLKRKVAALEDEKNRLYSGRKKARAERDELQAEIDRLKKDGVTDDGVKEENTNLQKRAEKSETKLQEAQVMIAFLSDNTHEWEDPGVALKAADLRNVEIDDDGTVHGMTSALEALAEKSPFLLKKKALPRKRAESSPNSTGSRPNKKRSQTKEAAERARVAAKYRQNMR